MILLPIMSIDWVSSWKHSDKIVAKFRPNDQIDIISCYILRCLRRVMQIRSPDSPNQIQDPHKPRLQTHFRKDNSGLIIRPSKMDESLAGCYISYVVTNLFKTIHTASGGCSQLLETFSNSAIVLWRNYNLCKTLSPCLHCLWSSSSTMIVVVTVVVIILINSITVVIVVVVIIITTFFMSPLYLAAWSLASPCIVFTALSIFANCSAKKNKEELFTKPGLKVVNFF